MTKIFILIEQAIGYGLLKAVKCKSTDDLLSKLQERKIESLTKDFELISFQAFTSAANAALNCVDIANGMVSADLERLLTTHLSDTKDTQSVLVVNDKKLLESLKSKRISNGLLFTADAALVFHMRLLRHNFHLFLNDSDDHLTKAHIGLGHGYSRIKIKFNVNRSDNMIIQTINLLDQMDKDINTMSMRLREWFGYHYPELIRIVPGDYRLYARLVQLIQSRNRLGTEIDLATLETVVGDSGKAQLIWDTARQSMGYELMGEDHQQIVVVADKLLAQIDQRQATLSYLAAKMAQVAPNFSTLVGDIVAARLISHAGSLINLAKFPASTIQILGAEKALFRAIKSRGNTPKYGLIFHSSFIGRAAKGDKGRVSRFLAAKISLAVRLDCFSDEPVDIFGRHLKRHVEDQLEFLETGKEPKKNFEVMEEAVKEAKAVVAAAAEERKEMSNGDAETEKEINKDVEVKKKKRKSEKVVSEQGQSAILEEKKSKKRKSTEDVVEPKTEEVVEKKEKKNKKRKTEEVQQLLVEEEKVKLEEVKKEKKKKRETTEEIIEVAPVVEEVKKEKKKDKKRKTEELNVTEVTPVVEEVKKTEKNKNKNETTVVEPKSETIKPVEQDDGKKNKKSKKHNKDNEEEKEKEKTAGVVVEEGNKDKSMKKKKSKKREGDGEQQETAEIVAVDKATPKKKKVKHV